MNHTPTPWRATETGENDDHETFEISAMQTDGFTGGYRWFNRADTEFLLRAVNAHEELIDALRFIRQTVHQAYQHEGPIEICRKNTCDAASQAIAKAEARP